MDKTIKKICTITAVVMAVFCGLALLLFATVLLPPVQRWARNGLESALSQKFGVQVEIGELRYKPLKTIELSSVDIFDRNANPMIGLRRAKADIALSSIWQNKLIVSAIEADSLSLTIRQLPDESYNIEVLSLGTDTVPETSGIAMDISSLLLTNGSATLVDKNGRLLSFSNIGIDIDDIELDGKNLSGIVENLSFTDSRTKRNSNFSCLVDMRGDTLRLDDARATFGASEVDLDSITTIMQPDGRMPEIAVGIEYLNITQSDMRALLGSRWKSDGIGMKGQIKIDENQIVCKDFIASVGDETSLAGEAEVHNYRTPEQIIIRADDIMATSTLGDICALAGKELSDNKLSAKLGTIIFRGAVSGRSNGIRLVGDIGSDIGNMNIDATADISAFETPKISGRVKSGGVDFGHFTGNVVRKADFDANVSGALDKNGLTDAKLTCHSKSIVINKYAYSNIKIEGLVQPSLSMGVVDVNDDNGHIMIGGGVDHAAQKHIFVLHADSLHTGLMNLTPRISDGILNLHANMEIVGEPTDNMTGTAKISKLAFAGKGKKMETEDILFDYKTDIERQKEINITSDVINGNLKGQFELKELAAEFRRQLRNAAEALVDESDREHDHVWATLDLDISNADMIPMFVTDDLQTSKKLTVSGQMDSRRNESEIALNIDDVTYNGLTLKKLSAILTSRDNAIGLDIACDDMILPALGNAGKIESQNTLKGNTLASQLSWNSVPQRKSRGTLLTNTVFSREDDKIVSEIGIGDSEFAIADSAWQIHKSSIKIADKAIEFKDIKINRGEHYMTIDGRSSADNPNDTIFIGINKLAIENAIDNSAYTSFSLHGDVSATLKINDIFNDIIINCIANIEKFYVNGDRLDRLELETTWLPDKKRFDLGIDIITDNKLRAAATGSYEHQDKYFDLLFDIDSISDGFLNFYLNNPIKDISGTTSGWLRLHGNLPDLKLDARLCVHETKFTVRNTLVEYVFDNNDSIILSPNYMKFCDLRYTDRYGNKGYFGGGIRHKMFSGLDIDIYFRAIDQLIMETTAIESPTYYGTIFANGQLTVTGRTDDIDLRIDAETRPKTMFYILPLEKSDISENNYIQFKTPSAGNAEAETATTLGTGRSVFKAELNINILPNAQIQAILNPRTNNMITATGNGKLRLNVDRNNDFFINGDYVIGDGIYNFSFENIINKRFIINNGSSITWNGDPYNAIVDLMATYKLKASLYDLVKNDADATPDLKRRVPINCNLYLTDRLLDPTIRFKIEIPSSLNFNQYLFDQYVSTEDEMNRQVFSLLLANRFYTAPDATSTTSQNSSSSYIGTTASELLSNQLSDWISQNKYNLGIGINYRPGDEVTNEEYEVALSTQLLDNKIQLSGNIGYGRDASEAATSDNGTIIGDFDIEVKLNRSGSIRAKAYTHSNNDVIYETSPTTQGIGLSYQEEFNSFRELFRKYWNILTGKNKRQKKQKRQDNNQSPQTEQQTQDE